WLTRGIRVKEGPEAGTKRGHLTCNPPARARQALQGNRCTGASPLVPTKVGTSPLRKMSSALVPGAAQHFFSGALQTRDRPTLRVYNGPGPAVHRSVRTTRCTASGTRLSE